MLNGSKTLFHIGSCTKAFLSASLGILMDDFNNGRNSTSLPQPLSTFNWETKVKDLLPSEWMLRDQFQHEKTNCEIFYPMSLVKLGMCSVFQFYSRCRSSLFVAMICPIDRVILWKILSGGNNFTLLPSNSDNSMHITTRYLSFNLCSSN